MLRNIKSELMVDTVGKDSDVLRCDDNTFCLSAVSNKEVVLGNALLFCKILMTMQDYTS
jgi:hypothetical protein